MKKGYRTPSWFRTKTRTKERQLKAQGKKYATDNSATIKQFGIVEGAAVDLGCLVWNGQYIEGPYVVSRRGLDIFVNGIRIQRGPQWPPMDYRVTTDPGDPPLNTSPFVGKQAERDLWSKKWRY